MKGIREVVERLDEVGCDRVQGRERVECVGGGPRHSVGEGNQHGEESVDRLRIGRRHQRGEDGEGETVELSGLVSEMGGESRMGGY